jgi:amino acid permease
VAALFPYDHFNLILYTDTLALVGSAPKVFLKTNRHGTPWVSVLFCSLFTLLAYMSVSNGAGNVFQWFVNMTGAYNGCVL